MTSGQQGARVRGLRRLGLICLVLLLPAGQWQSACQAMAPFVPSSAPTMLRGLPDPALCALRVGQPCLPRDSWWGGAALGVAPRWLGTTWHFAAPPYPVLLPSTPPRSLSLARAPQEGCRNWPPTWPEFIPFMPGAQALLTPRRCLPRGLYGEFPTGQRGFPCPPKPEH